MARIAVIAAGRAMPDAHLDAEGALVVQRVLHVARNAAALGWAEGEWEVGASTHPCCIRGRTRRFGSEINPW